MDEQKQSASRLQKLKDSPALIPALIFAGLVLAAFWVGYALFSTKLWIAAVGSLVAACAAGYVGWLWYDIHVLEPLRHMTESAKLIADGSYGTELPPTEEKPFQELTEVINAVSREINHSEKMQSEFISSISHELRTPLTAITGWSDTLMFDLDIKYESRVGLQTIKQEAARLTSLVEELLEFTRIQDGRFKLNIELLDIESELEDTIFTYREFLQRGKIDLRFTPLEEEIPLLPGDPLRLRQVFLNILDNAAKYGRTGPDSGIIEVSLTADQNAATVIFRDYGPGIPEDELPHVKEKFFKGRISKERGSGIGLAVCDEIVTRSGGMLTILNAPGGGTAVAVTLPFAPESAGVTKAHHTEVIE